MVRYSKEISQSSYSSNNKSSNNKSSNKSSKSLVQAKPADQIKKRHSRAWRILTGRPMCAFATIDITTRGIARMGSRRRTTSIQLIVLVSGVVIYDLPYRHLPLCPIRLRTGGVWRPAS